MCQELFWVLGEIQVNSVRDKKSKKGPWGDGVTMLNKMPREGLTEMKIVT